MPKELIAYTDYPIPELGDKFYTKAPMRECSVLSYDGENYCEVIVDGGERGDKIF